MRRQSAPSAQTIMSAATDQQGPGSLEGLAKQVFNIIHIPGRVCPHTRLHKGVLFKDGEGV